MWYNWLFPPLSNYCQISQVLDKLFILLNRQYDSFFVAVDVYYVFGIQLRCGTHNIILGFSVFRYHPIDTVQLYCTYQQIFSDSANHKNNHPFQPSGLLQQKILEPQLANKKRRYLDQMRQLPSFRIDSVPVGCAGGAVQPLENTAVIARCSEPFNNSCCRIFEYETTCSSKYTLLG